MPLIIRLRQSAPQGLRTARDGLVIEPLQHGTVTGSVSEVLFDASWHFQPLKTSLGVLAILGIAQDDGRDSVSSERAVLFESIVAQAALAHERLRLEQGERISALIMNGSSVLPIIMIAGHA